MANIDMIFLITTESLFGVDVEMLPILTRFNKIAT